MSNRNVETVASSAPIFAARLQPYRSLSPNGFIAVMLAIGLCALVPGTIFWALGAWPIVGFMGLDVLLVYFAFRLNFRSARAYESVELRPELLTVLKVRADGVSTEHRFNPYWARLEVDRHEEFGVTALRVASHGRALPIGREIGPAERAHFADAFGAALRAYKIG